MRRYQLNRLSLCDTIDPVEEITSDWGMIGHEWAVRLLQLSLARGQLSHAYLFLGPPRIGKTTLAVALAQAVNCTGDSPPCGECRSCRLIAAGRHPDIRLVEGGEVRAILIDQVRTLQHEIVLSPVEARRRVVILTDFQGATPEAANSLLKTLEEPPAQVMLILTASQRERLLPTIFSRCRPLWLRPPSDETIARGLQARLDVPEERAHQLARLAAGKVGWAVQAARDESPLRQRAEHLRRIQEITGAGTLERLRWARDLSEQADGLPAFLDCWLSWWRDLLLWRAGCPELIANVDQEATLTAAAPSYGVPELLRGLKALNEARRRLDSNANPRLTLEVLFLALSDQQSAISTQRPA